MQKFKYKCKKFKCKCKNLNIATIWQPQLTFNAELLNPVNLCVSVKVKPKLFSIKLKSPHIASKLVLNLFEMC